MADWNNPNPINTNPGGDTKYQGFVKAQSNFDDIYSKLNTVKKLQTGTTAPSNPAVGELWFDENTGILKRYDGTSWIEIVALPDLSNTSDTTVLNKIKNVDGAGSGLDADTVDGRHIWDSSNGWGKIPFVNLSGVMEIGKHIDFHLTDKSTADYEPRLSAIDSSNLAINGNKIWHDGDATKSFYSPAGYQKLPSGLIMQWGYANVGTGSSTNRALFTYPIAFPNSLLAVYLAADRIDTASLSFFVNIPPDVRPSATQCEAACINHDGTAHTSTTDVVRFLVIGY